jgi:hypothetical protein
MSDPRGFGKPTPPYDPVKYPPPPPWPLADDPRTAECTHDWNRYWGKKGERQRQCLHCDRWIWESQIWPDPRVTKPAVTPSSGALVSGRAREPD